MKIKLLRTVSLGTLGVYWLGIFIGTHIPMGVRGLGRINDKVLHFGAYAGLAFLLAAALSTLRVRHGTLLLPLVVAAVYGCVDELSQMAVPGRQAEVADWAADVFGAGVGVFAFALLAIALAKFFSSTCTVPRETVPESVG
ncbi:MAG: VanZ family protein [Planctomycetaceae bacterium]|nr:VanZ family protein [Planctomycetales bacterium]MCB9875344.1 VanZ family protein [Planctomycetaceae bacterium]